MPFICLELHIAVETKSEKKSKDTDQQTLKEKYQVFTGNYRPEKKLRTMILFFYFKLLNLWGSIT